ncbi:MAG TPA: HlyD family efflux transporter periplasmic adaptor subunit [Bryobacteraceae bacterium]
MNSFQRVKHLLRADSGLKSVAGVLVALGLGTGWLVWGWQARITRYELSDSARLELDGAAYPVQANAAGRLVASALVLGREVHAGDVLAELDDDDQRLNLQQERTHLMSLEPQLVALRAQMQSEGRGRSDEHRVLGLSLDAARAQYREAQAQAILAGNEAERARRLRAEGIMSEADAQRAMTNAETKRAAAESLKLILSRLTPEQEVRERDREVRQKQILGEIAKVESEVATSSAAIRRLEFEIAQRLIRASVSGRLGECAPLRPGVHINQGQQLGVILPHGKLQVIAEFQPADALGKVHPGQHATLRLQGFPWAQFGTVPAEVSRVAGDIRDGKVRVELAVNPVAGSRIPLQHGLPGSVEVEVERISPLALVLRSAGQVLGSR